MNKRKLLLYPYDITSLHFLQYSEVFTNNLIVEVVSPAGWGYVGKDAGDSVGIRTGVMVTNDFDAALSKVDGILLVESIYELDEDTFSFSIQKALEVKKEVITARKFERELLEKYRHDISNLYTQEKINIQVKADKTLVNRIKKPIVVVMGSGDRCNKFDIQLIVRDIFMRYGYNVTQIGSKGFSNYYGFYSFPEFVFDKNIDLSEKVIQFNHYISYLDKSETSDVIILGVPGGISPYDEKYNNGFGEINYIVSNAINADYVIFSSIFTDYAQKYFTSLPEILKYKFNYELDSVFLSNAYVNWDATNDLQSLIYTTLDKTFVSDAATNIGVYSIYDDSHVSAFEKKLIETLGGYGDYEEL